VSTENLQVECIKADLTVVTRELVCAELVPESNAGEVALSRLRLRRVSDLLAIVWLVVPLSY
jgi:hypothetical protein